MYKTIIMLAITLLAMGCVDNLEPSLQDLNPDGSFIETDGFIDIDGSVSDSDAEPEPNDQTMPSHCESDEPLDPGFVGLRRLNRSGYDNSLSDLIGIAMNPSRKLPADNVQHGFDNTIDGQSMSPRHFEAHHEVVEEIVDDSLAPPRPALNLHYEAEDLSAFTPSGAPINGSANGMLHLRRWANIQAPEEIELSAGQYRIRFRAYGFSSGVVTPPQVIVRFGSQTPSEPVDIEAVQDAPGIYEITMDIDEEFGRFALQFINAENDSLLRFPLYHELTECTVDDRMPDECRLDFDDTSVCIRGACHAVEPCENRTQCQELGLGNVCESNNTCRQMGHARCCMAQGVYRRWLWIDWVEIEALSQVEANPLRETLTICEPTDGNEEECARSIFAEFGLKAWRRPLTVTELDRLVLFVDVARIERQGFETAIDLGIKAILLSPNYLFRVEVDSEPDTPTVHGLSDFELATRLSYFIWNTSPDEALLALAAQGVLNTDEVLSEQLDRMLADLRAQRLHLNFGGQWLLTRVLDEVQPSSMLFPEFDEELREAMKTEAEKFFGTFQNEDRDIRELLLARETFINPKLAEHYGMEAETDGSYQRVSTEGSGRRGLFGQAGFLTLTSALDHTSVVKRGKMVLEDLLCSAPPPPPPGVEDFGEQVDPTAPVKERMAQHRSDASCQACHRDMDNIGYAFEHFDPIGRHREIDPHGNAIDPTGELINGRTFDGIEELSEVIVDDPRFTRCVTEKTLTFAMGRHFGSDHCGVAELTQEWSQDQYGFVSLIKRIVMSPYFRARRGMNCGD